MSRNKNAKWIQQANDLIIDGQGDLVRSQLKKIQKKGVSPSEVVDVAILARRVGMFHFATNLLYPLIPKPLEEAKKQDFNTLAIYASCNMSIGNYLESLRIFESLPENILTNHSIEYADCLFRCWDYQKGEDILKQLKPSHFDSYRNIVFGLNLAAALKENSKTEECLKLLDEIEFISDKKSYQVIKGNCLEIKGQIFFESGKYVEAESLCSKAEVLLKQSNNLSWIFARKWQVFSQLALNNRSDLVIDQIEKLRMLARKFSHWETLRDCDLFQSIFTGNSALYSKVYFGTPHLHFRKRAERLSNNALTLNPSVQIGNLKAKALFSIDLSSDQAHLTGCSKNQWTTQSNRLLASLCKDLYRPSSVYELFHFTFKGEYFNPHSSKERVYKSVKKLRTLLKAHPLDLAVTTNKKFGYRFRSNDSICLNFVKKQDFQIESENTSHLQAIIKVFKGTPFTRSEFELHAQCNPRMANRILKSLVDEGSLIRIGKGSQVCYNLDPEVVKKFAS